MRRRASTRCRAQGILTAVLMGHAAAASTIDGSEEFEATYRAVLDRFHAEHRATYALERRWPDSPFWARRQA